MTVAEFMLDYVRKHGWISVANILNDNESTIQPHSVNGFICASP